MRRALALALAILAIGYWAAAWSGQNSGEPATPPDSWRRTIDGWERNDRWQTAAPPRAVRLHPGIVAAGQMLASLLALAAARTEPRGDRPASASRLRLGLGPRADDGSVPSVGTGLPRN